MSSQPSTSSASSTPLSSVPITPQESDLLCTKLHAVYCFDVLAAHFEKRQPVSPPFSTPGQYALFVTWNTDARAHRFGKKSKPALRGCIGTFSPQPLAKGLRQYALVSALEDHRFSPIAATELPHLSVSVSILTPFTPIPDPLAWVPGVHGIHITFPNPRNAHQSLSATYLPEVTPEQGWSREEAILSAIQKAGWRGSVKVGDEVWRSLKVKVYSSQKAGVTWKEYLRWKETGLGLEVKVGKGDETTEDEEEQDDEVI
ncbi:AMMECR1 domain-containing protein [Papiliotrema laurentii]|uniref:AMMECR1 domain-containing protein n=1 Tax=Papiliotrema laurentii TaxID=5418 RepID=A0AAD9FS60_PAPLA|nr:AMMECR1 domain-containing protein [Papiliotrema laurentii]